jgi:hypothetical protein
MSLKTVLAGALLLASGTTLQAQEINIEDLFDNRYEISAGFGVVPIAAYYDTGAGAMDFWFNGPESVQEMYDLCYDATYSPTYSVEFAYHLKKRWDICAYLGYSTVSVDRFDPFTNQKLNHEDLFTIDTQIGARRYHVIKKSFRLYSQVTLGVNINNNSDFWDILLKYEGLDIPKNLGFQVTGLGLTFGKNLFGSFEMGWGTEYIMFGVLPGMKAGIGYRF